MSRRKTATTTSNAQRQQQGEPTVQGWMFLALLPEQRVIAARGIVRESIGNCYLMHFLYPVQYGLLVSKEDMQDFCLFPNGDAMKEFLQFHAATGGTDVSLPPEPALNDPDISPVNISEEVLTETADAGGNVTVFPGKSVRDSADDAGNYEGENETTG